MSETLKPTQTSLSIWASRHGINRFTAAKWARVGRLPGAYKIGKDWLLPMDTPVPAPARAGNPNFIAKAKPVDEAGDLASTTDASTLAKD